jgi:hypothetical protein
VGAGPMPMRRSGQGSARPIAAVMMRARAVAGMGGPGRVVAVVMVQRVVAEMQRREHQERKQVGEQPERQRLVADAQLAVPEAQRVEDIARAPAGVAKLAPSSRTHGPRTVEPRRRGGQATTSSRTYDHLAFLLALLLAATSLRDLIKIVTAFTIAHSVTLCLAGLGLLRIPTRLSEALIAASIVYVACENLRVAGRPPHHRALLSFSFGLVHGLGFATELRGRLMELGGRCCSPWRPSISGSRWARWR